MRKHAELERDPHAQHYKVQRVGAQVAELADELARQRASNWAASERNTMQRSSGKHFWVAPMERQRARTVTGQASKAIRYNVLEEAGSGDEPPVV